ncbi:LAQU0S02e10198g1_1 [Lachancea quebecensis]|uniref:LAQU0S02e10198g1_1 n=1 Tax=Lachancea quebecensis TaxID=1654605 RepID=A0A0P1KPT4_9SACH|nr:LAQU0S02e10198g1_1 [Lachancea quebecensis]
MQTDALFRNDRFQELRSATDSPTIKVLQKSPKATPSLPGIRQLLHNICAHTIERRTTVINDFTNREVGAQPGSFLVNSERDFNRKIGQFDPPHQSNSARYHGKETFHTPSGRLEHPQLMKCYSDDTASRQLLRVGRIQKPSGDLLRLANLVEASPKMRDIHITGNSIKDEIRSSNGMYQLKVAEILTSSRCVFENLQEWPLSVHSQDTSEDDEMHFLTEFITMDSLDITVSMAKKVYESLLAIKQWKSKHVELKTNRRFEHTLVNSDKGLIDGASFPIKDLCVKLNKDQFRKKSCGLGTGVIQSYRGKAAASSEGAVSNNIRHQTNNTPLDTKAISEPKERVIKNGHQCAHCSSTKTPEWRKGPCGRRSLCNACGLFYKKLVRKFGDGQASLIMKHRKSISSKNRKVPHVFDVPHDLV